MQVQVSVQVDRSLGSLCALPPSSLEGPASSALLAAAKAKKGGPMLIPYLAKEGSFLKNENRFLF